MSAAASPASSGQSSGGSAAPSAPQPVGGSGAAEGGSFDYKGELERTRGELHQTRSGMESLSQKTGAQEKTLERLREAFDPEGGGRKAQDPVAAIDAEMDEVINLAYEADKAGKPIPMTTKAYLAALQTRKDHLEFQKEIRDQMKALTGKADAANDPQVAVNRQAYGNMDSFVQQGLDQVYGLDESYRGVKANQFTAITKMMTSEIRAIQKSNPDAWERIRRDPNQQRAFVNHYLRQNLPPRAVEILEKENLQNTPMSQQELLNAFDEAAQIKDQKVRADVRAKIRQEILAMKGQSRGAQR